MARTQQKVASWYWVVSAALTPFILIAIVVAAYGYFKSNSYRAEAARIVAQLDNDHKQFEPLHTHIKDVAEVTGTFVKGDPDQFIGTAATQLKAHPTIPEEEQKGADGMNPVYRKWRDAEAKYYGEGDKGGMVHQYMSARQFLDKLNTAVGKWVAYKSYQIYTVKTIDLGTAADVSAPVAAAPGTPPGTPPATPPATAPAAPTRVVTSGLLERPGKRRVISSELTPKEAYLPEEAKIEADYTRWLAKEAPTDAAMRPLQTVTLELVLRQQMLLIDELVAADVRQYGLLVGEVSGDDEFEGRKVGVGRSAEDFRQAEMTAEVKRSIDDNTNRKNKAVTDMGKTEAGDSDITNWAGENKRRFDDSFQVRDTELGAEKTKFEGEKAAHESDRKAFVDNLKKIARFKQQTPIKRADADGKITYSDYTRKSLHIDLGRMDGVKASQRFEIWRYDGIEADKFLGVIEIVRTLSDYVSLCTVLELADENEPIRKGDSIVSRIWHSGRFLTVALHGKFEPPQEAYSRERLIELLKQAGVRIVDKVQPGTDVVVTGHDLLLDVWYRDARNDLRFETIKEEAIRLYIDPR